MMSFISDVLHLLVLWSYLSPQLLTARFRLQDKCPDWYLDYLDQQTSWMIISGLAIYLMAATSMCVVSVLALIWIVAWLRYIPYGMWEMFLKSVVRYNSALTSSTSFFTAAELFWESSWICVPSWNFQQVPLLISVPWPWAAPSQIRYGYLHNLFNASVIQHEVEWLWWNTAIISRCTAYGIALLK